MANQGPPRITSFLVVRLGVETERVIIWDTLEITVGRLDTQDIVVPDPEVSRRHAVLQRRGPDFLVEDLGSPLRSLVNGEPIKTHQLVPGDLITIGLLELQFGQTTDPVRPSGNVGYASQLKGFELPNAGEDAGGRTMLGVAMELPLFPTPSTSNPEPSVARVVTTDGRLEEAAGFDLPVPGDDDLDVASPPAVRDLDQALEEDSDPALNLPDVGLSGPTAPTRPQIVSLQAPADQPALRMVTLLVEVERALTFPACPTKAATTTETKSAAVPAASPFRSQRPSSTTSILVRTIHRVGLRRPSSAMAPPRVFSLWSAAPPQPFGTPLRTFATATPTGSAFPA